MDNSKSVVVGVPAMSAGNQPAVYILPEKDKLFCQRCGNNKLFWMQWYWRDYHYKYYCLMCQNPIRNVIGG